MPIIIPHEDAPQGSDKWHKLKIGKPSTSNFHRIVKANGERSLQRNKYLEELAFEIITGFQKPSFESYDMRLGIIMEEESCDNFSASMDIEVEKVSVVYADERKLYLCSPDRLCSDGHGLENKNARPHRQLERLKKNTLPAEHVQQVQGSMWVCEKDGWWFRSYCRGMRPLTILVRRDKELIKKISYEVEAFCYDLDKFVKECKEA